MKTVLISGANRGIGLETAKKFSNYGYRVFLGCREYNDGLKAADKLTDSGYLNIIPVVLDTTCESTIAKAVENIQEQTAVLDVLVNNAGIRGRQPQVPTAADSKKFLRRIFSVRSV